MYKFKGNSEAGEFVPGVPARDLTDDEAIFFDVKASKLYEKTPDTRAQRQKEGEGITNGD